MITSASAEVDLGLLARQVEGDDRHVAALEAELAAAARGRTRRTVDSATSRALLVDEALPDPARRVALLAVARPVLGQPARGSWRACGPDRRRARGGTRLRGGGTADASAWRTARRCTLWRRASSRIDTPSSR